MFCVTESCSSAAIKLFLSDKQVGVSKENLIRGY